MIQWSSSLWNVLFVILWTISICLQYCHNHSSKVDAFHGAPTPLIFGLGAILFRPKNVIIEKSLGDEQVLNQAGVFFTQAFWKGKFANGSGDNELSPKQINMLTKEQVAEFRRRYGRRIGTNSNVADRRAELMVCTAGRDGPIMGCVGIEVDRVSTPNGNSVPLPAPLMSNLAIGKEYRRKGLAEELVRAAEELARKEWGYDECFLYVEKRNTPALRLYRKLGYFELWEDDTARSLMLTESGNLERLPTILVCMRKSLKGTGGLFGLLSMVRQKNS